MKQFEVNQYVLRLSWLFLCIWIISMGMFIVFLAMGSPLWIFMLSGVIFAFFFIIIAFSYPKTVMISNDSIAFQMKGSDKIQTYKFGQLEFSPKKGYYELAVSGTNKRKKFWVSTKGLPAELEEELLKQYS